MCTHFVFILQYCICLVTKSNFGNHGNDSNDQSCLQVAMCYVSHNQSSS